MTMSMWRRAMEYLGLTGDDTYDDYDLSQEYERPLRGRGGVDPTGGRGRGYAPEYVDDVSRPAPRPMRDDSLPMRRPMIPDFRFVPLAHLEHRQFGQYPRPEPNR